MKKRAILTITSIITAIVAIGFISTATAGGGRGGRGHHGQGWQQYGCLTSGGAGAYAPGNISEEALIKLNKLREAFFKETEANRQERYEKSLALRAELAKENADPEKAATLQKRISELTAEIQQARLKYMIKNKDLDLGFGSYGGGGRMNYGPRMGYGQGYKGYNGCPGYGPGYWR